MKKSTEDKDREIESWLASRKRTPEDEATAFATMLSEQGLQLSDDDPPARFMQALISAVFIQRGISLKNGETSDMRVLPMEFAKSVGRTQITLTEYLRMLGESGINLEALHKDASDFDTSFEISRAESQAKAHALFEALTDSPFPGVSDEEIRNTLDSRSIHAFIGLLLENASATRGRINAKLRLANDPKQIEKSGVKECWELWQKNPDRYRSKSAFAADMLRKYELLGSQRVIERWCKEWESELS